MDKENLTDDLVARIRTFVPGISLDCVVFGYSEGVLKVLLLKYYDVEAWGLPGGFLQSDMEMHQAAVEVLFKRTGL
ncbi:MAG: NUDIX hydrolase, partial [Robiginitalea sp.]